MIPTALLLLALGGCAQTPAPAEPDPVAEALAQPLPDDSIYQLDVELLTQAGETTSMAEHRGHPTIVSMFYANCPMACPMLIQEVKSLEAQVAPEDLADLRVLLVSLDPDRDSPDVMREVVEKHELDTGRWTLARTDKDSTREVAAVLGISYRSLDGGEMNHSSILTLVDRQGVVQQKVEGLGKDRTAMIDAIGQL